MAINFEELEGNDYDNHNLSRDDHPEIFQGSAELTDVHYHEVSWKLEVVVHDSGLVLSFWNAGVAPWDEAEVDFYKEVKSKEQAKEEAERIMSMHTDSHFTSEELIKEGFERVAV